MEVKELGHLVLYVRNLKRSAAFYRDVLGWRQLAPTEELGFPAAAFSAPSNRTHHELLLIEVGEDAQALPQGRHIGLYHFGLKVGDTDDELRDALRTRAGGGRHRGRDQRPHRDPQPLHPRPRRQRDRALRRRSRRGLEVGPRPGLQPHPAAGAVARRAVGRAVRPRPRRVDVGIELQRLTCMILDTRTRNCSSRRRLPIFCLARACEYLRQSIGCPKSRPVGARGFNCRPRP